MAFRLDSFVYPQGKAALATQAHRFQLKPQPKREDHERCQWSSVTHISSAIAARSISAIPGKQFNVVAQRLVACFRWTMLAGLSFREGSCQPWRACAAEPETCVLAAWRETGGSCKIIELELWMFCNNQLHRAVQWLKQGSEGGQTDFHVSRRTKEGTRGGTMPRAPNHWGVPKSPNNVTCTLFNTVHRLPKDLGSNMGTPNLFIAPGRCLTSVRLWTHYFMQYTQFQVRADSFIRVIGVVHRSRINLVHL